MPDDVKAECRETGVNLNYSIHQRGPHCPREQEQSENEENVVRVDCHDPEDWKW